MAGLRSYSQSEKLFNTLWELVSDRDMNIELGPVLTKLVIPGKVDQGILTAEQGRRLAARAREVLRSVASELAVSR